MNEQIKSIALECYNPYGNFDIEKFAELIVKECAEKCVYVVDRQEILAHFGVEE